MKKFVLIIILISSTLNAEESYNITRRYSIQYGTLPNIESGAESTIGIHSLLFDYTNEKLESLDKYNFLWRFLNFSILQMYIGFTTYATIPHEFFGHYSRCKEFGINPEKFILDFPAIGGAIIFKTTYNTPAYERQMIASAGMETTGMIAYKATKQIYSGSPVPHYIGNFHLPKIIDGIVYIEMNVKPFKNNPEKYYKDTLRSFDDTVLNDPVAYLLALTESYGYYNTFIIKDHIWVDRPSNSNQYANKFFNDQYRRMRIAYWLAALDPVLLHYFYGNYQYLVHGKRFYKPYLFYIKQIHLMPSIRANLGELGAENYFDLFFGSDKSPLFSVYYREGGNMIHQLRGGGLNASSIKLYRNLNLNIEFDYWKNERNNTKNTNIAGELTYEFTDYFYIGIKTGYKDKGGLMGKPYEKGPYEYMTLGVIRHF